MPVTCIEPACKYTLVSDVTLHIHLLNHDLNLPPPPPFSLFLFGTLQSWTMVCRSPRSAASLTKCCRLWSASTPMAASTATSRQATSFSARMAPSDWVCECLSSHLPLSHFHPPFCIHVCSSVLLHIYTSSSLLTLGRSVHVLYPADFGVSARPTKGNQRRDTFIGTPYWYEHTCMHIMHTHTYNYIHVRKRHV